jgi:MFS family permease
VRERIPDRNIWLIFIASLVLGLAYGDSIALTSLHLDAAGFTKTQIGTLAAWFAGGIVAMSLPAGALVRRFSAKRTLVACLTGYTIAVTLFPYQPTYARVAAIRFVDGVCSVGIWVSCETILLSRSSAKNKAFVTSLYAMAMAIGYAGGAGIARGLLALTTMPRAFVVAGALALAATALVATRLDPDAPESAASGHGNAASTAAAGGEKEAAPAGPRPSGWQLAWRIKTSCFGTFAYGYFQASVVLFLPLYLVEHKSVPRERTVYITAIFALGMLLCASQAGRLGDRYGHLLVMRVLAAVGSVMVLSFVFLDAWSYMVAAIFVAGATLASISPVSLALQGRISEPRDYARANAIYNAFYAAGMLLGPPISSALSDRFGGGAMLYHLAGLWAAFVVFTTVFAKDDPAARRALAAPVEPVVVAPEA